MERWITPLDLLDRDLPQVFRRAFEGWTGSPGARTWAPSLDVFERDGDLHVRMELPGIDPANDVDIEVTEGRLTIRGDRKREETTGDQSYWRREMTYGHFERTVVLPQGVDASAVKARYDAGILDVSIPMPKPTTNKISVEVGNGRELNEAS